MFAYRGNHIVTACVRLEDTSTRSCTAWCSWSLRCIESTHVRRKLHSARAPFSSLTEGSGLPCHWSSIDIERSRPQKAQHDSPAVFSQLFPWEGARLLLCLPGCPRLSMRLSLEMISHWSSLTKWGGFKGGESVLHSVFARQVNTKGRFLILQWSVRWKQHLWWWHSHSEWCQTK